MDSERSKIVDYASRAPLAPREPSGDRWALLFGGVFLLLVPFIIGATMATRGTWNPLAQKLTAGGFIAIPVLALCALVSGIRGLMHSRYFLRSLFGLIPAGAAIFGAMVTLGWIANGYR